MSSRILVALRVAAPPDRTFDAFWREIGLWWRPNRLFEFTPGRSGALAFEPGLGGRFTETYSDGTVFEIGRITEWDPPERFAFTWRQASFELDQDTHVRVCFESIDAVTRVTVEHVGWDAIPRDHVARHTFPIDAFQQRHAEWWRGLLESLNVLMGASGN